MSLAGQVALVTGASRGIGRGIALQLGQAGATVYVTGRQPKESDATKLDSYSLPSLEKTAKEVTERGGKGIVVYCDHGNMDNVKDLFERIDKENNGKLDILVNNAYSAVTAIFEGTGKKFYQQEAEVWDEVNNVGLRNHYYCCVYGSRMMVKNKKGLIINISSPGGLRYLFNIPYGVGKEALDRMSADMSKELRPDGVTVISLWPGAVRTELVTGMQQADQSGAHSETAKMFADGETIEYPGIAVVRLAGDKDKMLLTGRTLLTADLGDKYGFVDIDGRTPPNLRSVSRLLNYGGWKGLSDWVPHWVRLPGWYMWAANSRL
ncbi:unnamed protein product, partial [Mesorhabditis belari]|uniref:Dehydrogenase/reductase SDR family member 1 n=1 Tax=Mesorhabditis belari TaxID=2138241 RepID=A0AAF3FG45_9BILA